MKVEQEVFGLRAGDGSKGVPFYPEKTEGEYHGRDVDVSTNRE